MYLTVVQHCRTCHECQLHSTYRNTILIQPQYVHSILRHFDANTMNMPKGKRGYKYIVDLVDNLMGWTEAKAVQNIKSDTIAQFLCADLDAYSSSQWIMGLNFKALLRF